jgi:hypothetical protein
MAGPAPKTRDWVARENKHKPKGLHVIVGGLVEVNDADKTPVLKEGGVAIEQVLPLELTIVACKDPAIKVKVWKAALFHKEVTANQYEKVVVSWDGKQIAAFPVIDDTQHARHAAAATKALNAKHQAAPKKAAAKKAAPKKAAPKKAAPKKAKKAAPKKAAKKAKKAAKKAVAARAVRAVGGWARGVKKALKRAMKPARKAAKKKSAKRKGKR